MNRTAVLPNESGASLAPARRDLYRFLSAAFLEAPGSEFLQPLREASFLDALEAAFSPALVEPLRQYAAAETSLEDLARQARQEFMNLFKVPGAQYVTPYESVFRDTREINGEPVGGLLMGPSARAVQQWYRLAALEIAEEYQDLPDHIGLELHYLAFLCEKEQEFERDGQGDKLRRAREMQRDFLKAHVCSWINLLAKKIGDKTDEPLYRAVADMACQVTRRDLATLEELLGPSGGSPTPDYTN